MTIGQSNLLPLIRHFNNSSSLACVQGRIVSSQQFIHQAMWLAGRLPQQRYVLNLCEDRYHFLLGFAAALIAGQVTLMPSTRATQAIQQVQKNFPGSYCLSDQADQEDQADQISPAGISAYRMPTLSFEAVDDALAIPHISADQEAAILFTSGSTGQPTAHLKTWGMLVQGADQLQHAFNVPAGSLIVGTIPPQHMFGLESTIIFPLQWGCTIHHARPHLPADIEEVVSTASAPVWLMTTPLHLRACAQDAPLLPGIAGAISATMPLDEKVAYAVEQILKCPLYEIYGCTEAGIVATRRPTKDHVWQLCDDFRVQQKDDQIWLEGARVHQALALSDSVELHGEDKFSLQGRLGDMVKIAGKRTSIEALNAELLAIDGVVDGAFFWPDADGKNRLGNQRMAAFAVTDQLQTSHITEALRKRIDPVFIPRPIWIVAQLPREANGKLPYAALVALAAAQDKQRLENAIASDHPALKGHFPGNPIVPGVLLLNEVMRLTMRTYRVNGIKQAKFHVPLLPQQNYAIRLSEPTPTSIKFSVHHEETLIANGILNIGESSHAAT